MTDESQRVAAAFKHYETSATDIDLKNAKDLRRGVMTRERFPGVRIDHSAHVEDEVEIGAGTSVWVNVQIRRGAKIGRDCILSKDVFIDTGVTIGDRVKIQNGVSVYHGVTVEDGALLGPHCVFTNDQLPRSINRDGSLKTEADWRLGEVVVHKGAAIGAGAHIVCGKVGAPRVIGRWSLVGTGAIVTKDVPAYAVVVGAPAKVLRFICPVSDEHATCLVGEDPEETDGVPLTFNDTYCLICRKSLEEVLRLGDHNS